MIAATMPVLEASTFDLLIVGAGMVGSALAAALAKTPLKVGLLEAQDLRDGPGPDGRSSALGLGTVRMLDQIGAWTTMQRLGVSPIHRIQVSDGQFSRYSQLRREDLQVEALGYIVENRVTQLGLQSVIQKADNIELIYPAKVTDLQLERTAIQVKVNQAGTSKIFKTQLVIGADGSRSLIRQWAGIPYSDRPYAQVCIVTNVTTEHPHDQVAYERFQPSGPFAILPMVDPALIEGSHQSAVVWTVKAGDQERLLSLNDLDFITAMQPSFGSHLGPIVKVSARSCYQPRWLHSHRYVADRVALVGDAAHSTHPVGGQGVNMGMRDVALLATLLIRAGYEHQDLGSSDLLNGYHRARYLENAGVLMGTDLANRLFSNEWILLQGIRRLGLMGLNQIQPLKTLIMRQAMGIAFYQPRLQQDQRMVGSEALNPASGVPASR